MKNYLLLFLGFLLIGCSGSSNTQAPDFRTAKERTEEEMKGSVFGKDALGWKWNKDTDEKTATSDDPLWTATSKVMAEHPISFNNFHARIIQTDWIINNENPTLRYRFTVRLLGKSPKADNLNVVVIAEKKQGDLWAQAFPDAALRDSLINRILMEANRIYDINKRD